ncbi:hypothetical protein [Roseomonas indoligenes]|uniref:Uncharacterized protein n=1 Tax=Roseomonas indoligenes TaxID=2820811 RepID=A0A940S7R5_9PROT|nr:hypothetical protein [Pararoseomonas indoligenes]MBP0493347.1 hypothetical protein [Pararoseomonas indoligenes]
MSDSLAEAAARLEAAVERLARAAAAMPRVEPSPVGVPVEEVAALSARLEATIARLRAALPEGSPILAEEGLDEDAAFDEAGLPEDEGGASGPTGPNLG